MTFHLMNPAAGQTYPAFSNGKRETVRAKLTQMLVNPNTGEVVGEFPPDQSFDVTVFRNYRTAYFYPVFVHISDTEMYYGVIDSRNFLFGETKTEIPSEPAPELLSVMETSDTETEFVDNVEASISDGLNINDIAANPKVRKSYKRK